MGYEMDAVTESLLSGFYNIIISRQCMLIYTNDIQLHLMEDSPNAERELKKPVQVGQTIINIASMIADGFSVKLINPDQILNIYNRIEQYIREANRYYNPNLIPDDIKHKLEILDNLAKTIFENYKITIVHDSDNTGRDDKASGYYDFTAEVDKGKVNDFSPEEFVRSSGLDIFKDN